MWSTADQVLFAHVVGRSEEDMNLATAALLIGEFEYPGLDVAHYLSCIDEIAERSRAEISADDGEYAEVKAINRMFFAELGYHGNTSNYYDPKNSFLNEVIERRVGIPISLAVLYIEVGTRLGLKMGGLNFPGHFLVRYHLGNDLIVIDPFHNGITLALPELRERLRKVLGTEAELGREHLTPAGKHQIIARILNNLAGIYRRANDTPRMIAVIERMLVLDPDNERLHAELDHLKRRTGAVN